MADERRLGSLAQVPELDRWVVLAAPGRVQVRTGKVELGQGILTALAAIAADELGVDPSRIDVVSGVTGTTPNEWITAGSGSVEQSGMAVRQACAHARRLLLRRAAEHLDIAAAGPAESDRAGQPEGGAGAPAADTRGSAAGADVAHADAAGAGGSAAGAAIAFVGWRVDDGVVVAPDGRRVDYWTLAAGRPFDHRVEEAIDGVPAAERRWTGRGLARVDLAAKVRGEAVFVHDLVLPGMRHARVVRTARPGARLTGAVPAQVGRADVVRNGSFLAVVADREADAVAAAERLAAELTWEGGTDLAADASTPAVLADQEGRTVAIVDGWAVDDPPGPAPDHGGAQRLRARYNRPFVLHGSIGPSAAVAHLADGRLQVWSHTQGPELLRHALARVLRLDPGVVTVTHVQGAGCYGHNGADDVALDAALVAVADPGRPVALKWTRADEHRWEPAAPAMAVALEASLDADGRLRSWQHDVHSYPHMGRPYPGEEDSGLLAAWDMGAERMGPLVQPTRGDLAAEPHPPRSAPQEQGVASRASDVSLSSGSLDSPWARPRPRHRGGFHAGGFRNADPLYRVGEKRVVEHYVADAPLRTSSTRSLGAFANVFAIESFMDELAAAAGRDPVAFRLDHLDDPRARAVVEAAVDLAGGLEAPGGLDAPGRGLAFARYENVKAYCAVVAEVTVDPRTGEVRLRRGWIAADAGEVIDPDGLANQLEGGLVQAASWTLKEQIDPDPDPTGRPGDWEGYPILRFGETPELVTRLLDQPGRRVLGAGEASTGPTAAAIANAVAQATGARLRDLPLRPDRVKAALQALL